MSASDSSATDIKLALNDLPSLSPNMVQDVTITKNGADKTITVTFSSDLGIKFKNKNKDQN